ncbi:MAG: 2OG-Fe(II) oxygenase [Pseudomonadota bacterium]
MSLVRDLINLDVYPLDRPESSGFRDLVATCKAALAKDGLFNLPGFVRPAALERAVRELSPLFEHHSFVHARRHNIYFRKHVEDVDATHPALREFETFNRTVCADQMGRAVVIRLYEWPAFANFLSKVMGKDRLFTMADPLARVNAMSYGDGEALNWHFDRSEFTTTLLLQAPEYGGDFEYDQDLRTDVDPNYGGVVDLLEGRRSPTRLALEPGTLNVFKGKNTAHRATPTMGPKARMIAVFSFYETEGVEFSDEERIGFYGRSA